MKHTNTAEKQLHKLEKMFSLPLLGALLLFPTSPIPSWCLDEYPVRVDISAFFSRQILSIVSPHVHQSACMLATNLGKVLYKLLVELGKLVDKKTTNMRKQIKLQSWRKTFVSGLIIRKDYERKIVLGKASSKHIRKEPIYREARN